jgi:hydroxymethylglutaryl-CoA synthase
VKTVGIDAIRWYTPPFSLDLRSLALARDIDPDKFTIGLGQHTMSIMPPDEDIVSLAANAAFPLVKDSDQISMLLFATESGVDQSKAAGLWVHHLLGLPSRCRVMEVKQACYSATCALQLACNYLLQHPGEKVLLIASDNARYGLRTPGEATQGCGAAAMILTTSPRLLALEPHQGFYAAHVMDFWRPNYTQEAIVDGRFSTKVYLQTLAECWKTYNELSGNNFSDHARYCYHIPFSKMAEKAHERLAKITNSQTSSEELHHQIQPGLAYSRLVGNAYTAALYIGLSSLLETEPLDLGNSRIGFFSYGSGCVGEFFSGIVQPGYKQCISPENHSSLLASRKPLTCEEYEHFFTALLPTDGSSYNTPQTTSGRFRLKGIANHERLYEQT